MYKIIMISLIGSLLLTACTQPKEVNHYQLENDKKELRYLSKGYQSGEVKALAYIHKFRVLRKKIAQEEEMMGNGHTHIH